MSENHSEFSHVERKVYNNASDRIVNEVECNRIFIEYKGTQFYGDVVIEGGDLYPKEYKEALRIFMEEYLK